MPIKDSGRCRIELAQAYQTSCLTCTAEKQRCPEDHKGVPDYKVIFTVVFGFCFDLVVTVHWFLLEVIKYLAWFGDTHS